MTLATKEEVNVNSIAARISELVTSKIAVTPTERASADLAEDAEDGDEADKVALEVCAAILDERGQILEHKDVAKVVRALMFKSVKTDVKRQDRIAEIQAAFMAYVGSEPKAAAATADVLKKVSAMLFAASKTEKVMNPRPMRPDDVCLTCARSNPANISFLRYPTKSGVPSELRDQVNETTKLVEDRLKILGVNGNVSVSVVIHRGFCKAHGRQDQRVGDGVAEIPGVLMRVDFGSGVVIEGEHEARVIEDVDG